MLALARLLWAALACCCALSDAPCAAEAALATAATAPITTITTPATPLWPQASLGQWPSEQSQAQAAAPSSLDPRLNSSLASSQEDNSQDSLTAALQASAARIRADLGDLAQPVAEAWSWWAGSSLSQQSRSQGYRYQSATEQGASASASSSASSIASTAPIAASSASIPWRLASHSLRLEQQLADWGEARVSWRWPSQQADDPHAALFAPYLPSGLLDPYGQHDLQSRLWLQPLPDVQLDVRYSHRLASTQAGRPPGPVRLDSFVSFTPSTNLDIGLSHNWNPRSNDAGTLRGYAQWQQGIWGFRVQHRYTLGLEGGGDANAERGRSHWQGSLQWHPRWQLSLGSSYLYRDALPRQQALELTVNYRLPQQLRPLAELRYRHDPLHMRPERLGISLSLPLGAWQWDIEQEADYRLGQWHSSRYRLSWAQHGWLELSGLSLLPAELFGLAAQNPQAWRVTLRDSRPLPRWQFDYRQRYQNLAETDAISPEPQSRVAERRLDSLLRLQGNEQPSQQPALHFSVQAESRWLFPSANNPHSYLASANLRGQISLYQRFSIAAALGYQRPQAQGELQSARLDIRELSISARVYDELYVALQLPRAMQWRYGEAPRWQLSTPRLYALYAPQDFGLYAMWDSELRQFSLGLGLGIGQRFYDDMGVMLMLP